MKSFVIQYVPLDLVICSLVIDVCRLPFGIRLRIAVRTVYRIKRTVYTVYRINLYGTQLYLLCNYYASVHPGSTQFD